MKIGQIRFGFATNSSSSHSVILATRPQSDYPPDQPYCFGWENFILASEQEKRDYFFMSCYRAFEGTPEWSAFIDLVKPTNPEEAKEGYIDHESAGIVGARTLEGVQEQLEVLLIPEVTILGGNDNEEYDFGISGTDISLQAKIKREPDGLVLFSEWDGTKIHLFDTTDYIATSPELVDIKITDWCDLGCKFCYQDSTKKGKPADIISLFKILDDLSSVGTWEVALGGGEPASHPEFLDLLAYSRLRKIVPNYTTRNYDYIWSEKFLEAHKLIGSVGISVATPEDVREVISKVPQDCWKSSSKISLQIPMGAQTEEEFDEIISLLNEKNRMGTFFSGLILLGYKMVGRGPRTKNTRWYETVSLKEKFRGKRVGTISIDTEMARNLKTLRSDGISHKLYMENEGRVSCYIDAVSMKIAPSSYCEKEFYYDYNYDISRMFYPLAKEYKDAKGLRE